MPHLQEINDRNVRMAVGNRCLSRPVLAIGTVASGINTGAAVEHSIGGIVRNLAALTSQALVTGGDAFRVHPANTVMYYVLAVDAANAVRTFQGTFNGERLNTPTGISVVGDGAVPDIPDNFAPFGLLRVTTGPVTFTPGTTLLNAANVTTAFFDLACMPLADRP